MVKHLEFGLQTPYESCYDSVTSGKAGGLLRLIMKTNTFPRHGYNQFFLNGRWVSAAATFDKVLCEKNGLPTVEFDGKRDAILPEKDLKGAPYIEYVEKFSPKEDLPFDWIKERVSKLVGLDKRPWLNKNQEKNQDR